MLRPGQNVLPPVRFEDSSVQGLLLRLTQGAPTCGSPIVGISLSLGLEDAVDGPNQLDQFIDPLISLRGCYRGIVALPLQLIHNGVLALLFPMKPKHIFE